MARQKLDDVSPLGALRIALMVSISQRWAMQVAKRKYAAKLARYENEVQDNRKTWRLPLIISNGKPFISCSVNNCQGFFNIDLNAPQSWIKQGALDFCKGYSKANRILSFGMPYKATCAIGVHKFSPHGGARGGYNLDKEAINKIQTRRSGDLTSWGVIGFDILNPFASDRFSTIEWDSIQEAYCLTIFEPQ